MADVKISNLGAISAVAGEDLVAIVDDPSGTPASRKATITQIATFINASALSASSTDTFTNKTFDAEGTGNSISNIDVANLKSGVLDTDLSSVSGSDDTIASAKAVKAYVDAQILTEDTLTELNDTTITSVADNEVLQYDSSSSTWINQTFSEADIGTATAVALRSTIASPTFTGTVVLPNVPAIVTTQLNLKAPLASPALTSPSISYAINAQTGTTYTAVLADAGKIITSSNSSTVVITIPPNSSVAYPIGSSINVISIGAGLTNFAIGAGVTINSTGAVPAAPVLRIAHSSATAIKIATDTWQVVGDIT